jgi:isopenicillin N synthase-like dioxygenase
MEALAFSLGLPDDYFVRYHDRTDSTLRLLHYPLLREPPTPGQLRADHVVNPTGPANAI